jgi:hypothetical protein
LNEKIVSRSHRIIIATLRDLINLILFFATLYIITWYIYNNPPELIPLKNVLLPMKEATLLCILASIIFVFINRITTYFAIKIMQNK